MTHSNTQSAFLPAPRVARVCRAHGRFSLSPWVNGVASLSNYPSGVKPAGGFC